MDTIFVEHALKAEIDDVVKWGLENYLDIDVLGYPTTKVLKGVSKNKNVLFMPIQLAYILESLALNPGATKHEITVALRQIVSQLRFNAKEAGIGEIYFLGSNEHTNEFASKHDFIELPWKVYRMKTYFEDKNENKAQGL